MKFSCEKNLLLEAVTNVGRAVSAKSMHPSLEGIFLKTNTNTLFLAGYDLELAITTQIEASIHEPGSIVMSARLFGDILRKLPDGEIMIKVSDKLDVDIQSGLSEFHIKGLSSSEYPDLPQIDNGTSIMIPQNLFKGMIRQTIFAVSQSDSRPAHKGVRFEMANDNIRAVAVDGSRLAMRNESIKCEEEIDFNIPGKTLNEVSKLLNDEDKPINLVVGRRHCIMEINGYAIITRLQEGEFLAYEKAIPQRSSTTVRIKTRDMIDCIERAALIINDPLKSPLVVSFHDDKMHVSCNTTLGSANDEIYASIVGNDVEIGFNSRFILDALRNTETDEILLELDGPLSPMKMKSTEGESFLFLVLPVRIKKDI